MKTHLRNLLCVVGSACLITLGACSAENEEQDHSAHQAANQEQAGQEQAQTVAPSAEGTQLPEVFIKAEPAPNAELERPPRSLRIYLTELPNTERSSVKLFGPQGEVALRGFHTMGANDLMIEVEDHPLPNGEYTVQWTARFGDKEELHTGSYQFTVAAAQ